MNKTYFFLVVIVLFQGCKSDLINDNDLIETKTNSITEEYLTKLSSVVDNDSLVELVSYYDNKLQGRLSDEEESGYYSKLGVILYQHAMLEKADSNFFIAQQAFAKLGDSSSVSHMRMNRAAMNEMGGNYEKAVTIYLEVIDFFSRKRDSMQLANSYSNLGVAYEEMELAEKSIDYHKKALELRLAIKDTINTAYSFNNIGVVFMEVVKNKDSALYYYQKAYKIFEDKKALYESSTVSNNIGHIHLESNNLEEVEQYFAYSYKIYDSLNNEQGRAEILRSYGQLYFAQGKDNEAIEALKKSLSLNEKSGNQKEILEINRILSKIYIAAGDYPKAIQKMQIMNRIKDSILDIEKQKAIADMETKYQVKEKNKTIEVLRLEEELNVKRIRNQTVLIFLLTVIFGLIVLVLIFRSRQNKLKHKQLRLELQNYLLRIDEMQTEIEKKDDCNMFSEDKFKEFELSEREIEVLKLISQGFKNAEIAEKLFVSQNTIKTHIKNIYVKLDVKNRVEALKRVDIV
ncbi:MAG: tetratricopeptide repeat protein [Bacteroidetes bacterium]|nr:tetratricopeptide repeat protein [Bacteroidota bacterium]